MRHQLDIQSKQIKRVLDHHHIPAEVTGGSVRPRVVSFDLQTSLASGLEFATALKDDLMAALGVGNIALANKNGRWQLRVPQPNNVPVPLLKLMSAIPVPSRLAVPIGVAEGGAPVMLHFPTGGGGHTLIAGDVGAGKTSLLRAIAAGLALTNRQSKIQLQVMDPTYSESTPGTSALLPLAYFPHMLADPALDIVACATLIGFLAHEMAYRRQERIRNPRIVVLIDHVLAYLEKASLEARNDLMNLLQYGARAGIYLIMATDRPGSPLLDSTLRSLISSRIVGRSTDVTAAGRIAGRPLEKASLLYGQGDFLFISGEDTTYFQAAYIGDYDLHMMLTDMLGASPPRLLARPYDPRQRIAGRTVGPHSFTLHKEGVELKHDISGIILDESE